MAQTGHIGFLERVVRVPWFVEALGIRVLRRESLAIGVLRGARVSTENDCMLGFVVVLIGGAPAFIVVPRSASSEPLDCQLRS